jgi:hypothetical protein
MGWSGGSPIFSTIISEAKKAIPDDKKRKAFYKPIYNEFRDSDWDTYDECMGEDPVYDALVKEEEDFEDDEW